MTKIKKKFLVSSLRLKHELWSLTPRWDDCKNGDIILSRAVVCIVYCVFWVNCRSYLWTGSRTGWNMPSTLLADSTNSHRWGTKQQSASSCPAARCPASWRPLLCFSHSLGLSLLSCQTPSAETAWQSVCPMSCNDVTKLNERETTFPNVFHIFNESGLELADTTGHIYICFILCMSDILILTLKEWKILHWRCTD